MTKPLASTRWEFGRKLTVLNKAHEDMGIKLRVQYLQLRQLTRSEEVVCGKCSAVGANLDKIYTRLGAVLGRDPTPEEWADACKLTVEEVRAQYHS
jgi:hypothetical protein